MDHLPSITGSNLSYNLQYAASWLFDIYARDQHQSDALRLARDAKTGDFVLLQYEEQQRRWVRKTAFDAVRVEACLTDSKSRLRIFGWNDYLKRTQLQIYLDLQFVNPHDLREFMYKNLQHVHWSHGLLSALVFLHTLLTSALTDYALPRDDMVQIFREVPGKLPDKDALMTKLFPSEGYLAPRCRHFRPELAKAGNEPVEYIEIPPDTCGLFDGYTKVSGQNPNSEPNPMSWVVPQVPFPNVVLPIAQPAITKGTRAVEKPMLTKCSLQVSLRFKFSYCRPRVRIDRTYLTHHLASISLQNLYLDNYHLRPDHQTNIGGTEIYERATYQG